MPGSGQGPRLNATAQVESWIRQALAPPPDLTIWEWADTERELPPTSAVKGKYRSSIMPYWRGVVEFFSPKNPRRLMVIKKGARLGATVSVIENTIGYHIAHDPCPMLLMRPTVDNVVEAMKTRLRPMFDSTPALADLVGGSVGTRKASQTLNLVSYPGGALYPVGANSPSGLDAKDARIILFDEADRGAEEVAKEGDPFKIALVRSRTFPDRKAVLMGTPTTKEQSRLADYYERSDQQQCHVPCPHCGAFQVLHWGQEVAGLATFGWGTERVAGGIVWDGIDDDGAPINVRHECEHCGEGIYEHHKAWMFERHEWIARYPGREIDGRHIPALYSALNYTWHQAVVDLLACGDDPLALKVFVNTTLAETWDPEGRAATPTDDMLSLRERWWTGDEITIPHDAGLLTAFVDVQAADGGRLEWLVRAWGLGEESWTIEHRVIPGDPSGPGVWDELEKLRLRTFLHASGARLPIAAMGVDSGYLATEVYRYCEPRQRAKVWATKGVSSRQRVWPRQPSVSKNSGCPVYIVGIDPVKTRERARLNAALRLQAASQPRSGAGMLHFPDADWCGEDYFAQLTSEVVRTKTVRGRPVDVWHLPAKRRNEILDLHVGTYAVLQGLLMLGTVKLPEAVAAAQAGPVVEQEEPRRVVGFQGRKPRPFGSR